MTEREFRQSLASCLSGTTTLDLPDLVMRAISELEVILQITDLLCEDLQRRLSYWTAWVSIGELILDRV